MPIFNVDVTADPHHPRVVGPDHAPVPAINDFLRYLEQCARSSYTPLTNTERARGRRLVRCTHES
jgi:hypothetical protein